MYIAKASFPGHQGSTNLNVSCRLRKLSLFSSASLGRPPNINLILYTFRQPSSNLSSRMPGHQRTGQGGRRERGCRMREILPRLVGLKSCRPSLPNNNAIREFRELATQRCTLQPNHSFLSAHFDLHLSFPSPEIGLQTCLFIRINNPRHPTSPILSLFKNVKQSGAQSAVR